MTTCPNCGGSHLRQITPGFFECASQVQIGAIPPGVHGNTEYLPIPGPCGHRFQVGNASPGEPCFCGRDSIGACKDCGQRLCGMHGTSEGEFLCRGCLNRRTAEQSRARAAAQAEREEATATRHGERLARILASTDRGEIAELLTGDLGEFTLEEGQRIWASLLALDQIPPTHEMVTMQGRMTVVGFFASGNGVRSQPGSWKETGTRESLWLARGAARKFVKGYDGYLDSWSEGLDAVLDASGRLQLSEKGWRLLYGGSSRNIDRFVLPKGAEVNLTREDGGWRVRDAYSAYPYAAHEDALSFVQAVAAIARGSSG